MTAMLRIAAATVLHPDMAGLRLEAAGEGFRFVDRLIADWHSGANRFAQPGELFLGGFREGGLLAVCGLNRDPYTDSDGVGRLRHLYVLPRARRQGIALALVTEVLRAASGVFDLVRLRTDTCEAAEFYDRLGFTRVPADETASHVMVLPGS